MRSNVIRNGGRFQPFVGPFKCFEESLKPPVLVHMVVSSRPYTKFLAIISHGEKLARVVPAFTEYAQSFFRFPEGDRVAEGLQAGHQAEWLTLVFCDVDPVQARRLQSRCQKMSVIKHHVLDAGFGQRTRQTRLPDPLRDPRASGCCSPMLLKVIRQLADLRDLIGVRNGRQYRLIVAAPQKLHLSAPGQLAKLIEKLRVAFFQPFEQYPGVMEAEPDARMLEEDLHEGRVSPLVSFFDDVVEVPHGLVGMDYQSERNFVQG